MDINEIFGSMENLNRFYTHMAKISDMAISKHANLLLNPIIQHTVNFAHEFRPVLDKLAAMAVLPTDQAPQPECSRALDKKAQEKQEAENADQKQIPIRASDLDAASVDNNMPNCC